MILDTPCCFSWGGATGRKLLLGSGPQADPSYFGLLGMDDEGAAPYLPAMLHVPGTM